MARTSRVVFDSNDIVYAGVIPPEINGSQSSFVSSSDMSNGDTSRLVTPTLFTERNGQWLERSLVPEMVVMNGNSVLCRLWNRSASQKDENESQLALSRAYPFPVYVRISAPSNTRWVVVPKVGVDDDFSPSCAVA